MWGNSVSENKELRFDVGNNVELVGDELGPNDAPAVLMLHGGGQTRRSWDAAQRAIAEAGFRAITLDMRGHGDSSWAPDKNYKLSAYASDLAAVVERINCSKVFLVGASLGGITSMLAVGEKRTKNIAGIVLVDVVHRPLSDGVANIRGFMAGTENGFDSIEEAADAVAAYLPHRKKPRNSDGLARNLRQGEDGRWRWHWDPAFLTRSDGSRGMSYERLELVAAIKQIEVPTLLIRGGKSEIVSEELAEEFLQLLPTAEYAVVPGATHMVSGDDNDAFGVCILDFLERHSP